MTAYVLDLPSASSGLAAGVDVVLGEDWLYANKCNLNYGTYPFAVHVATHIPSELEDQWNAPSMSGIQVLQYATAKLYHASTVPLMSDK